MPGLFHTAANITISWFSRAQNRLEKKGIPGYIPGTDQHEGNEDYQMPRIKFLPSGTEVEVTQGKILLDAALDNNVKINHNCGGNCACSTCHIIVEQGYETLNEKSEDEADMLDEVENLTDTSRLACQCKVKSDLVVRIPEKDSLSDEDL
jgi:2Fe-2S ferredoxin